MLVTLVLGIAACGNGGDNRHTAPVAAKATATAVAQDLGRSLLRNDEEPGFRPGAAPGAAPNEPDAITGVKAFVRAMNLPPADERRLTSEGFIAFTAQPIRGRGAAGVTNVALYETAEGAKRSLAHDLRPDVIRAGGPLENVRFFSVAGIPGARGWTATLPGEPASHRVVANVLWVQGRCMHVLGNQGGGPFIGQLSRGARAIYARTGAQCPCAKQTPSTDAQAAVRWPAPRNPLARTLAAGLRPERKEFLLHHYHAHLDVFADGKPVVVPAGIGIRTDDPDVQRFTEPDGGVAYGGITRCRRPCISPLHTHDATGVIHTESKSPAPNTLGQFFTEWGVRLSGSCVGERCSPGGIAFYVDGKPYRQDPRAIELTDRKEIAIVIGTPPAQIPKTADFSKA